MGVFCVSSWPDAIAHIDADAFFVECERATNPLLRGKAVVVGKERGIATALSYEAKALGIKRGMRIVDIKKQFPGVVVLNSDYEKYSMFSVRMFEIVRRFSPVVEEYSIDEAFVDLKGLRAFYKKSYRELAVLIQKSIKEELGISVSLGVAPTKVLAKIASKLKKPGGIVIIKAKEIQNYLNIPVGSVWGIGPNTEALLAKFNIHTAIEFAKTDIAFLSRILSKPYIQIHRELRGEKVFDVDPSYKSSYKSISKATSFKPISDKNMLFAKIAKNVEDAAFKARRYALAPSRIAVFLKTDNFATKSVKLKLRTPTNITSHLLEYARIGFEKIYKEGKRYRQTGVVLLNLTTKKRYDLFEDFTYLKKSARLYGIIDDVNTKFGRHSISVASTLPALEPKKQNLIIPFLGYVK